MIEDKKELLAQARKDRQNIIQMLMLCEDNTVGAAIHVGNFEIGFSLN